LKKNLLMPLTTQGPRLSRTFARTLNENHRTAK